MNQAARIGIAAIASCLSFAACGGSHRAAASAGPPPEVVKPMQVPPSPYYIIYTPPVSLAKPPDTTAHARKPKS